MSSKKTLDDEELGFIIAHSIGHAKNDDFTFPALSNAGYYLSFANISHGVTRALENGLLEKTPSLLEAFSIVAAPFVCAAQYYVRNSLFSETNIEADQEALKLCPDTEVATNALMKLEALGRSQGRGQRIINCLLSAHPENYTDRIQALKPA